MCSVQQSRDGEEVIRHRTWGAAVVGAESRPLPRLGCAGWAPGELGSPGEVQGWCDQRVRGAWRHGRRSLGSCEMGSGRGHGGPRWEWGGPGRGSWLDGGWGQALGATRLPVGGVPSFEETVVCGWTLLLPLIRSTISSQFGRALHLRASKE